MLDNLSGYSRRGTVIVGIAFVIGAVLSGAFLWYFPNTNLAEAITLIAVVSVLIAIFLEPYLLGPDNKRDK